MKKISSYQFIAILLCSKLFCIMTYIPDEDDNSAIILISIALTIIIEALLVIPIIAFYNKNNGEGLLSFASSKSRVLGIGVSILFLLFSLWSIIETMGDLTFFLQYCFFDTYASWAVIIVISATAFYVAHTGISNLARISGIILITTIICLGLIFLGFKYHVDIIELNIAVAKPVSAVAKTIPKLLASAKEIVAFVILLDALRSNVGKTIYSYLGTTAVITLISATIVIVVLQNFVYLSKLPFFTLSAYSQTKIIQHYEGFFMVLWTLCALIKLTLFTICVQHCIHQILPNLNSLVGQGATLAVAGAITLPFMIIQKWEAVTAPKLEALFVVVLVFAIPLLMLLFRKRKAVQEVD
ncbi:MAG: GerAB/ArcD/ProY family transporter [Ruminococcus sp.]|nr:GerAB/ArcD/ProY family transporter [Ruminococcus sp.]